MSTTLLQDSQDVPLYFITSVLDISERKRAVAELQIKNQVLDESVVALSITDSAATMTHANPEFLRMWRYATEAITGRSRQELIGTDFAEYFTEPERARAGYQKVFRRSRHDEENQQ